MEANFNEGRPTKEKPTETSWAVDDAINSFFEGVDICILEEYSGFGHLEFPKKVVQPESGGLSPSSKLEKQFPAPSADLEWKKTVMFLVPADTSMLFGPVGVAIYLRSKVNEEDQMKINEVAPSFFNEA